MNADGVKLSEGFRPYSYDDPRGFRTIGIGFNMDRPGAQEDMAALLGVDPDRYSRLYAGEERLSDEEIDLLAQADMQAARDNTDRNLPWLSEGPEVGREAFQEMAFQMGTEGMLGFKDTIALAKNGEWAKAADEVMNSAMARQTPARANKYREMFLQAAEDSAVKKPEDVMLANLKESVASDLKAPESPSEASLLASLASFGKSYEDDDSGLEKLGKSVMAGLGEAATDGLDAVARVAKGGLQLGGSALEGAGEALDVAGEAIIEKVTRTIRSEEDADRILGERELAQVDNNPLEVVGELVQDAGTALAPTPATSLPDQLAEGVGQLVGGVAAGLVAGPLGAAGLFSASAYDRGYEEAIERGATQEDAEEAAALYGVVGMSEALPIDRLLKVLKVIPGSLKGDLLQAAKSGSIEAAQEVAAGIAERAILNPRVKEEYQQGLLEGAGNEATVGGILGFAMDAVMRGRNSPLPKVEPAPVVQEEALDPAGPVEEILPSETTQRSEEPSDATAVPVQEVQGQEEKLLPETTQEVAQPEATEPDVELPPEPEVFEDGDGELIEVQRDQESQSAVYRRGDVSVETSINEETGDVVINKIDSALQDKAGRTASLKAVVDQSLADGRDVVSTEQLSVADASAYRALRKQGYSVLMNPERAEQGPAGVKTTNESKVPWIVKVTKDVRKDDAIVSSILADRSAIKNTVITEAKDEALTGDQLELRDVFRSAFNREIIYVDGDTAQGFANPNNSSYIFVSAKTTSPVAQVAGHELLHTISASRPDLYNSLKGVLEQETRGGNELGELAESEFFKERGRNNKVRQEEAVADFVGIEMFREENLVKLRERNPEKFAQLSTYVRRWWDGVLEKLRGMASALQGRAFFLDEAVKSRDEMVRVLDEASKRPASLQQAIDAREEAPSIEVQEETAIPEPVTTTPPKGVLPEPVQEEVVDEEGFLDEQQGEVQDSAPVDERTEEQVVRDETGDIDQAAEDAADITEEEAGPTLGEELLARRKRRNARQDRATEAAQANPEVGITGRLLGQEQGRRSKGRKDAILSQRDPLELAVMKQRGARVKSEAITAAVQAQIRSLSKDLTQAERDSAREWIRSTKSKRKEQGLKTRFGLLPQALQDKLREFDVLRGEMEREAIQKGIVRPSKFGDVQDLTMDEVLDEMAEESYVEYVRREYKLFDFSGTANEWVDAYEARDPRSWRQLLAMLDSPEGRKYAKNHGITGKDPETMALTLAENLLNKWGSARASSDVTSRDISALKAKKQIGKEIRHFLGERTGLEHETSRTIGTLEQLITDFDRAQEVADAAFDLGEAVRETNVERRGRHRGWKQLDASVPNANHPFYKVWVSPEAFNTLKDPDGLDEAGRRQNSNPEIYTDSGWLRPFMAAGQALGRNRLFATANSYTKGGIILTNIPSYALNASSVIPLIMASGAPITKKVKGRNINDVGMNSTGTERTLLAQALADAALMFKHKRYIGDQERFSDQLAAITPEQQLRIDEILEQNLIDESALSEEMTNQIRDMVDAEIQAELKGTQVSDRDRLTNFERMMKSGKGKLDRGMLKAGAVFSFPDTMARIAVYHNEKAVMMESGIFPDTPQGYQQAKDEAGLRARANYLTYSRIPILAKTLNNFPFSAFLSFQVSLVSTAVNNAIQAGRDLKLAKETDNAVLREHAMRKMTRNATMHLAYASIFTAGMQLLIDIAGWGGDEEERELRDAPSRDDLRASWNKGKQHIYLKSGDKMLEFNSTDMTPFAAGDMLTRQTFKIMKAAFSGEDVDYAEEVKLALEPMYGPIVGSKAPGTTLIKAGIDLAQGDVDAAVKGLKEVQPGATRIIGRLASGDDEKIERQLWGIVGRTPVVQKPKEEASFKGVEFYKAVDLARKKMNNATRFDPGASASDADTAFRRFIRQQREEQRKLREVIKSLDAQGVSRRDMLATMKKSARLSSKKVNLIERGRYALSEPSWRLIREERGADTMYEWRALWRKALREE